MATRRSRPINHQYTDLQLKYNTRSLQCRKYVLSALNLKSCNSPFVNNCYVNCAITLKFCTEHGRALCKISKWLYNLHSSYGQQNFTQFQFNFQTHFQRRNNSYITAAGVTNNFQYISQCTKSAVKASNLAVTPTSWRKVSRKHGPYKLFHPKWASFSSHIKMKAEWKIKIKTFFFNFIRNNVHIIKITAST